MDSKKTRNEVSGAIDDGTMRVWTLDELRMCSVLDRRDELGIGNPVWRAVHDAPRYMSGTNLNPNWNPEPADEFGVVSGTGIIPGHLPGDFGLEIMQRKNVPEYAERMRHAIAAGRYQRVTQLCDVYFVPQPSQWKARRFARELDELRALQ
jgi:hypothetical protein